MTALAKCTGVTRKFGEFTAVKDVGLEIGGGEIVGLLGANGAGKTTLIRMLLGLISTSEGTVELFGEPPSRRTRRRLGYVPQGLGLYDDLTPSQNLAFASAIFGPGRGARSGRGAGPAAAAGPVSGAGSAGLPEELLPYAGELVGSLPLGVQRRVAFAQALSHGPDLLILDEPTSGVDPLGRARLWETIADAADAGAGVLVTTHYMEEAQECDRLVIMADGQVVARGTSAEIVGSSHVVVVDAESWADAFGVLERAGFQVALAGRRLRVPGADPEAVRQALGDVPAMVRQAPATLEERFFELTERGAATGAAA